MQVTHSDQYRIPCVVPDESATADDVILYCRDHGAIRNVDGEEFCVVLRHDIGPELWTERALRSSLFTP